MTRRALNYPAVLMDLGMSHLPKRIQWSFQTCRVRHNRGQVGGCSGMQLKHLPLERKVPWWTPSVTSRINCPGWGPRSPNWYWILLSGRWHAGTAPKVLLLILYLYHSGKQWLGRTLPRKFHEKPFIQPQYVLVLWTKWKQKDAGEFRP